MTDFILFEINRVQLIHKLVNRIWCSDSPDTFHDS